MKILLTDHQYNYIIGYLALKGGIDNGVAVMDYVFISKHA
jgi:hypothetical protein